MGSSWSPRDHSKTSEARSHLEKPNVQCDQFNHRLHVLLDERILAERDEALIQHASECPNCHSILEMQQQLFGCLQQRQQVEPRGHGARWSVALAVTAAVLMILAIPPLSNHSISEQQSASQSESLVKAAPHNPDLLNEIIKYFPEDLALQQSTLTESIWLNPMSHSIRPFTESMTSTLNVIRRGWVRPESSPTSPTPQASRPSASFFI